MQCNKCREEAVTFQQYSGNYLCRRHFIEDIESKAKHVIRNSRGMRAGDSMGVDVSGNCASMALLFFLHNLFSKRKDIRITAVIIDAFDENSKVENYALRLARELGIPFVRGSLSDVPDHLTDRTEGCTRITGNINGKANRDEIRSAILHGIGKKHGMTKIATGRCLDEESAGVLMNMLRGDAGQVFAGVPGSNDAILPIITPFIAISENEIILYAKEQGLEPCDSHHPHKPDAFGQDVKIMLDLYTSRHPATKYSLLHLGENIRSAGAAAGVFEEEGCCQKIAAHDMDGQCNSSDRGTFNGK